MFDKKGLIIIEKDEKTNVDDIMMLAIDSGADDVEEQEDSIEIITSPEQFEAVKKVLEENDIKLSSAEITFLPKTTLNLSAKQSESMDRLMEALEEHDDVQNVYTNYEPSDEEE